MKSVISLTLTLMLLLLLSACSGTPKETKYATDYPPHSEGEAAAEQGGYATQPDGRRGQPERIASASRKPLPRTSRSYPPSAPDADAAEESYPEPAPWRRPGLATRWGEARESRIREVRFHRQHSSPSAVVSMYYDDEAGVQAATGMSERYAYAGVFPVRGGALTVALVDSDGDPLPSLQSAGKRYVMGDEGERYQIQITNHTPGRFEIVATVDGLDVIDGQEGDFGKRGYLVDPWGTLTIEGFRDSYDSVRAFRFGAVEDSYAAKRGKGMNIGVIGVALFEEEGFYWGADRDDWHLRQNANPFPGRFAPPPPY